MTVARIGHTEQTDDELHVANLSKRTESGVAMHDRVRNACGRAIALE